MSETELVKTDEHAPPTCPACGVPLHSVRCEVQEIYTFMPEAGYYEEGSYEIGSTYKCPACGTDLKSLFPEGIVDWGLEQIETTD